jgi:hypothetical protein
MIKRSRIQNPITEMLHLHSNQNQGLKISQKGLQTITKEAINPLNLEKSLTTHQNLLLHAQAPQQKQKSYKNPNETTEKAFVKITI